MLSSLFGWGKIIQTLSGLSWWRGSFQSLIGKSARPLTLALSPLRGARGPDGLAVFALRGAMGPESWLIPTP